MTDLSHHVDATRPPRELAWRPWPSMPYVCVLVAGAAGLYAGRTLGADASAYEDRLLLLLRFMAAMKFAGVLFGAGLTHWRLRSAIPTPLAAGYLSALAAMSLAAGLIWSLGAIALGALLFHVGLLAFLVLAWKDEGVRLPTRR